MKRVLICFGLAKNKTKLPESFIEIYHTFLKKIHNKNKKLNLLQQIFRVFTGKGG